METNETVDKLIDMAAYRKRHPPEPEEDCLVTIDPPYLTVKHRKRGVVVREERLLSETLLREILCRME